MYSSDGGSRIENTRYDNADAVRTEQCSNAVASMFVSLKLQGTVRCLNRALKGPRSSQNEALMVTELPGCQTVPPRGAI